MIKFNKISLDTTCLTKDEAKEAMAGGEASVVLGASGGTLKGVYKCERMNAALMANVGVSGDVSSATTSTKSDIKLCFATKVVHTVNVPAGSAADATVNVELDHKVTSATLVPNSSGETNVDSVAIATSTDNTLTFTPASGTIIAAGAVKVEMIVPLGECVAEDDNIAATDKLTVEAGEMHFNALVRVLEPPHLKPNLTSTTVRDGKVHL